jgi:hypothetical protein
VDSPISTAVSAVRWLARRKLELALFLLGFLLRATMRWSYLPAWSYDSEEHWAVVQWIVLHGRVPRPEATLEAFHPPLFYAAAAWLFGHGVTRESLVWFPIACGTIRLALIWAGLEMYLPGSRWARCAALALAAVLPASIHLDGMIYPEAMSGMWVAAALLLVPLAFRSRLRARWPLAGAVGLILGLAMLTKISALAVIAAIGAGALLELLFSRDGFRDRCLLLLPWAGMLAVCVGVSGWYFARNVRNYHRPFITSFDLPAQRWVAAKSQGIPYLRRRPLGFFVGWDRAIYAFPYNPSGIVPQSRFFPVALASTFVDYWDYSFSGVDPGTPSPIMAGSRPITREVLAASQMAVLGGTLVCVATLVAWFAAALRVLRQRDWGLVALLLVPLFTLLSALHFAVAYPIDSYGVVKGVYMQFGAPPLYALFGVAVGWSARKAARWPLLGAFLVALWMVASYSLYCRLRLPILPLG